MNVQTETEAAVNRSWYILWAPKGFGGTTRRIEEVQDICRTHDEEAVAWYPLYPETHNGKTCMRPFYSGYMFVRCQWLPQIEQTLGEEFPVFTRFLRDIDTHEPVSVSLRDMQEVERMVSTMLDQPDFILSSKFEVGTPVKVLKKPFFGLVGKVITFSSVESVVVELDMFGRTVPVTVDAYDLERLI